MNAATETHCAVCGAPAQAPFHRPQSEIGPDLDWRPGEPAHASLPDWIVTCTNCGAAAPDLAALPQGAKAVVESDAYHALRTAVPEEMLPFLRWAMICRETGDRSGAAEATLQAAWAADDAAAMADAARLRREAAALWGEPANAAAALRLIDVLRRAGEFEAAEARAAALATASPDADTVRIVEFQRARIAARDVGRHLTSRALADPPPGSIGP